MQESQKYNVVSRLLHWGLATLFIGMLCLGLYMSDIEFSPFSVKLYGWHKATGVVILFLVAFRIYWRYTHRVPKLPEDMRPIEKRLAHLGHLALYVLMVAMPLSGWLMSSAFGSKVSIYGLFTAPSIMGKDKEMASFFHEAHEVIAYLFIAVIVGHVLAALYHLFIRKDGVLHRMLWVLPLVALLTPAIGHTADKRWVLQKDFSYIQFIAFVNNAPSQGKFTHYTTDLKLDPADLTKTTGTITVSLTEIDADYPMVGDALQKKDWFNTAKWPDGTYKIDQVVKHQTEPDTYVVLGDLTLRDTTKPLTLMMHISTNNEEELVVLGTATLKRLEYGVGQDKWADTSSVADNVELQIQATFKPF